MTDAKANIRFTFTAKSTPLDRPRYSRPRNGSLIRLRRQQYCCRLFLKLRRLKRVRNAARLFCFKIPVEAFTPPCINPADKTPPSNL